MIIFLYKYVYIFSLLPSLSGAPAILAAPVEKEANFDGVLLIFIVVSSYPLYVHISYSYKPFHIFIHIYKFIYL